MNSLIKETNDNLKAIVDTLKGNLDSSMNTLDSIQMQMDKKVEEAKKYKIQVDSAKEAIKDIENDNKSLELSLRELNDKYGKMNLVSVIEAGNREIKAKMNDNLREINKLKDQIAELTSRARTIKDLLMNLKKDKTIKEERLENLKVVYEYYNQRINDVIDFAFNHSENLSDYRDVTPSIINLESDDSEVNSKDLDNTMVFDEIANIDGNRNFVDEMSFISEQIDNNIEDDEDSTNGVEPNIYDETNEDLIDIEQITKDIDSLESTQLFSSIINPDVELTPEYNLSDSENFDNENVSEDNFENINTEKTEEVVDEIENDIKEIEDMKLSMDQLKEPIDNFELEDNISKESNDVMEVNPFSINEENAPLEVKEELNTEEVADKDLEDKYLDEENEERLNKINNLFSTLNNINVTQNINSVVPELEKKIDDTYQDVFGETLEIKSDATATITDIFGNPIKNDDVNEDEITTKPIEEVFVENGIDFNKFKDDEKNYLKEIYDEEKFSNIFATLKRNKINVDNLYNAFNIFGEMSANELESLISKLLNIGQSAEAIAVILEKLPKISKYNLDEAIISYGDYIKDIDITELIMKAKELYKNGGNV